MSNIQRGFHRPSSSGRESLKDSMVEREFEAAEVLAGMLSNSSALAAADEKESNEEMDESARESCERDDVDSNGTWGSKGKRSNKRVRSESPPVDSVLAETKKAVMSPLQFDADEAAAMSEQEIVPTEEYREDEVMEEKNCELAGPSPMCQSSHFTGGKGRKNLSEAEKEARKLKRVLANRESARQTIRRRQALYEELRRKVVDLMRENENLKKEKYSAVDEYKSLQSSNKNLNDQVTKVLAAKLEHNRHGNVASAAMNSCYSAFPFPNFPPFLCKEMPSFVWPSHVNPSHLGHCGGSVIISPEKDCNKQANHTSFNCSNDEQEISPFSLSGLEGSRAGPWCIMQCPWLMPLPTAKSSSPHLIQFLPTKDDQVDDNVSPTRNIECVLEKRENIGLFESTFDTNRSCENVFGSLDGLHFENGSNSFTRCETTENHLESVLSNEEVQLSIHETKKTETTAMEARRKRKELMKLKNIQNRPLRRGECGYN